MTRSPHSRRRAASAVELAIVAPLLLTVLFAIMEFGWYFMVRTLVHHAAAETTRVAVLPGYECEDAECGAVDAQLKAFAWGLLNESLNVPLSAVELEPPPQHASGPQAPCARVTVRLNVQDYNVLLPGFVLAMVGLDTEPIDFTVVMVDDKHAGEGTVVCQDPP